MSGKTNERKCEHCIDGHRSPESRPWAAWVAEERDSDGQPTHIRVSPTGGQHVAESDAEWLRTLMRSGAPHAAGRLVGEPTDEQVDRAAKALDDNFNPDRYPIMAAMFRDYATTALAAAGVAPQAPSREPDLDFTGELMPPPVFDVDKIAEVIEGLDWAAEHGGDDPSSEEIARAVVTYLEGESK